MQRSEKGRSATMGDWDATCLISNLGIKRGDKIRLIMLERQVTDRFWYSYPNSAWQVVGLPVRGEYNHYGSISGVDQTSPEARLMLLVAKRLFCGEREFDTVEDLATYLWRHSRWIYQRNERGDTVAGWAEVSGFGYDATGSYGRLQDKGRDKDGQLLPNHYKREFGYTLVLEEFYEVMQKAASQTYGYDANYCQEKTAKAIAAKLARQNLRKEFSKLDPTVRLSEEQRTSLDKLQQVYSNWQRDFIPQDYEGFAELETLLLVEAEAGQSQLNQALAQFIVFNEAMGFARRHYSPQSTGEQYAGLNEYKFHQTLAQAITNHLAEQITALESANTYEESDDDEDEAADVEWEDAE